MFHRTITIATRKSPLAMWQAHYVKDRLQATHQGLIVEINGMLTLGDKLLTTPLNKIGGKGLFVKELEKAMLERRADIAVHSIKDMPMDLPDALTLATICERADPRDAFVSNKFSSLSELPEASVVGTSSLRRMSQIKALYPNLNVLPLDEEQFDAIILAVVGLERLELQNRIAEYIDTEQMLPAAGQGAIGIECREDDEDLIELLAPFDDAHTRACISAERRVTQKLGGSCQIPIGAFAQIENNQIKLKAMVGKPDGTTILTSVQTGPIEDAVTLGNTAADDLLSQGAGNIIKACCHPGAGRDPV